MLSRLDVSLALLRTSSSLSWSNNDADVLAKTPKYGLLYNSTFIGRAGMRNKGRISRFLANKCALASRIDCFSDIPLPTYGEHMRQQVEDRLKFYESGELPKKNLEVMKEAGEDVEVSSGKVSGALTRGG